MVRFSLIEFDWVFSSFGGRYRVFLGFTGFYWVFNECYWVFLVLLVVTGYYRVLLGSIGFFMSFTGLYWVLFGFTRCNEV